MIVTGGYAYQGYSVGIMKFEGKRYPVVPGDVANATTYPFPVLVREIPGVNKNPYPPLTNPDGSYTDVVQKCITEAQALERDGWTIRGNCHSGRDMSCWLPDNRRTDYVLSRPHRPAC